MAAQTPSPSSPARVIAMALAAGVPFALYLATASGYGYWLDAGEFVAASAHLGISHPPGHPLAALVGRLFAYVPLGPLPLRVALGSATLTGLAAALLFRSIETTIRAAGVRLARVAIPLALGGTWLVATSWGWWFQAVRPEVYALQAALIGLALEKLVSIEGTAPVHDLRPLYVGSLGLGLGLANHHFLALLVLPAGAATLARVWIARGLRPLLWMGGFVAVGLATYVYLPLRALADPPLNLGEPTTLARLWWVVSAQAFQGNTGGNVPGPLWQRFADVAAHGWRDLHWGALALAAGGIYTTIRLPALRRVGALWTLVLAVFVAARAWLGFVRSNPDALGYLMPAYGAVGALAAAFLAASIQALGGERPGWRRALTTVTAVAVAAGGLARVPQTAERASLAQFTATDAFDTPLRRELPPRAVVLAHSPATMFRFWGGRATEQLRPDVTLVPMPLVTYPGMVDRLVEDVPGLRKVLRGYLVRGELRQPDLQSLAARRPLLIEMDPRVPPQLYETLVPRGLYHEILADGTTDEDERLGAEQQAQTWQRLYALLGKPPYREQTREQLLWRHYAHALYYAGFGDRDRALEQIERALRLSPKERPLRALERALQSKEQDTPVNVEPFRVGPPSKR